MMQLPILANKLEFKITIIILISVYLLIHIAGYKARENDSRLYTIEVQELSQKPLSQMIAPTWNEEHNHFQTDRSIPYIQDHLIGHLVPALILTKIGFSPKAVLYYLNLLYKLTILYVLYLLALKFYNKEKALVILWGGQLLTLSLGYQLRANHEQPLLLTLVLIFLTLFSSLKTHIKGILFSLLFLILFYIKGAFALLGGFALASYLITHWERENVKTFIYAALSSLILLPLSMYLYEFWFKSVTGYPFFSAYWSIQISSRSIEASHNLHFFKNFLFYLSRLFSTTLPWSALSLIACAVIIFQKNINKLKAKPNKFTATLLIYIGLQLLFFSSSNRLASRYLYQANILTGVLALLFLYDHCSILRKFHEKIFISKPFLKMFILWAILTSVSMALHFHKYPTQIWK